MTNLEPRLSTQFRQLETQNLIKKTYKIGLSNFLTVANWMPKENEIVIFLFVEGFYNLEAANATQHAERRVLQLTNRTKVGNSTDPTMANKIFVRPDAVWGICLSIFIFFIAYVGVMCLYNVDTPKQFASKPFKFGREM